MKKIMHYQAKKLSRQLHLEMTQMVELSGRGFKITMINTFRKSSEETIFKGYFHILHSRGKNQLS